MNLTKTCLNTNTELWAWIRFPIYFYNSEMLVTTFLFRQSSWIQNVENCYHRLPEWRSSQARRLNQPSNLIHQVWFEIDYEQSLFFLSPSNIEQSAPPSFLASRLAALPLDAQTEEEELKKKRDCSQSRFETCQLSGVWTGASRSCSRRSRVWCSVFVLIHDVTLFITTTCLLRVSMTCGL